MKDKILITGVGGGVGQSIIKSLQGFEYEMVGVDCDALAAGLYAVPVAYRVPRADDPNYVDRLLEICEVERCGLCLPGLDVELLALATSRDRFGEAGTCVAVSKPETIVLCDDKLATAAFLDQHGLPSPWTTRITEDIDSSWFPFVLKPQWAGSRSVGVFVVTNRQEFDVARQLIDWENCVIQEYLEGDEFTSGTVRIGEDVVGPIVMRRTLRGGDTYKAFVVVDQAVQSQIISVIEALEPFGACNVQFRLRHGVPVVFEVNPRCSGTTAARTAAGFNEPKMIADKVLRGMKMECEIREVGILRYWNELKVDSQRMRDLAEDRRVAGSTEKL